MREARSRNIPSVDHLMSVTVSVVVNPFPVPTLLVCALLGGAKNCPGETFRSSIDRFELRSYLSAQDESI